MTNAEKRALLAADGVAWPECHGEPMLWNPEPKMLAGGRFRCRVERNQERKRLRTDRVAAGCCLFCGGPLATETMCRVHADGHADLMATPRQRLIKRSVLARARQRARAAEGFQSTGIGEAAITAALAKRMNPTGEV